jgi:hypothetical protein
VNEQGLDFLGELKDLWLAPARDRRSSRDRGRLTSASWGSGDLGWFSNGAAYGNGNGETDLTQRSTTTSLERTSILITRRSTRPTTLPLAREDDLTAASSSCGVGAAVARASQSDVVVAASSVAADKSRSRSRSRDRTRSRRRSRRGVSVSSRSSYSDLG